MNSNPQRIDIKIIGKAWFIQAFFFCALGCVFLFTLSGCSSGASRLATLSALETSSGYSRETLVTSTFPLLHALPPMANHTAIAKYAVVSGHADAAGSGSAHVFTAFEPIKSLRIVIEGDGYAWINRYKISGDPTPKDPIGLKIAMHSTPAQHYLARPCQYVSNSACGPVYWTAGRYRPEVFQAYMEALNILKKRSGAEQIQLTGFSGGGYIALNLAAMRNDITDVTTIAGLLDPEAWTHYQDISTLDIRSDARALLHASKDTAFTHYCSADDDVMPCLLTAQFIEKAQDLNLSNHRMVELEGGSHQKLWKNIKSDP